MTRFIPWNSQSLDDWSSKYATGKFIDLDGLSTHYIEKGSGDPVILLHGFFFDSYMWNKNIDILAEKYKVYALDLWGFGYSTRETLEYGYPLYSQQLLQFMNALGISKASLIGQSMGAGTIIYFTLANRARVEKIILVDAAGLPNPLPMMARISNLPKVGEFLFGLNSNFIRKMTLEKNFLFNKDIITEEYFNNATRFHQIKGSTEVMLSITRKQFFDTLTEEITKLGSMDLPTLIAWGGEDQSIPLSVGEELHSLLKGSQLEILNLAGHCAHDDQADLFNELVLVFLSV